jgi:catalase (peroxidase I)
MIGWNPQEGRIQSWTFSSDGGHAVLLGPLRIMAGRLKCGITIDGTPTSSVNFFVRLDDNAYAWQSVQRTKGGVTLPDTDEVVLKRQPVTR